MMACAGEIIGAIQLFKPTPPEFSFLMSLIFCYSICNTRHVSPEAIENLRNLSLQIENTMWSYMAQVYGQSAARIRWTQIKRIFEAVLREQDVRFEALKPFRQRHPDIVKRAFIRPVCKVVLKQFWNMNDELTDLGSPILSLYLGNPVETIADNILTNIY